ncbi:MAG TPA: ABC transporter permease [Terriglobales bacterium]|nr:ABC transporter permease [Terriglobales bacterium]
MLKSKRVFVPIGILVIAHCCFLFARFFAPYSATEQHREFAYAPPMRVHFVDASGRTHLRPFVYRLLPVNDGAFRYYEDGSRSYPLRFLRIKDERLHLFAADEPGNLFLLGTDGYGRDVLSRILFGGRISLTAAAIATLFSLVLGATLGAIAGYFGGAADALIMRGSEAVMSVPWIYLLLAIRSALPLHLSTTKTFLLLWAVIGAIGWGRPARLVRGVVLSARERPFVAAARGFGASEWYLLRRHVLPQTVGILITQAVVLLPQFVTAEAALSFLGLGISEPMPSWGNMLSAFQQFQTMTSYWWMAAPILALVGVCLTYVAVADGLHEIGGRLSPGRSYA